MLGQKLAGRYELTRVLGAGGFGQTYLAMDTHGGLVGESGLDKAQAGQTALGSYCVVKQLKPASQDRSFLTVARRLFETEAKTLRRLGSHPQIPSLIDSFEEDNEFYLVQEYVDGTSLEDEIAAAGQFDETRAIALLEGVLPVLDFIHEHHVIHRDLKPDNLIRRRDSNEIVLIDFGAVKEIRTRIITGEQTALTIGIGTQGYTPSEQLAGKPRYSSDIFALGMTAIQAVTGKAPVDLPEDPSRLEACWEGCAEVSPGLVVLLNKMTRHYIYQRYDSVQAVQADLARLEELPLEAAASDTYLETSTPRGLLGAGGRSAIARWRMGKRAKGMTVALSTLLTSALVLGLRQIGAFVPAELLVHDTLASRRAADGFDSRFLIVEVTENDARSLGQATPSDSLVSRAIENLQQHQPASIGLDLLRDLPQFPGTEQLAESLQYPNVVTVKQLRDTKGNDFVPSPPGVASSQVSFSNILPDRDLRVRRALLGGYASDDNELTSEPPGEPVFSLGTELAVRYLAAYEDVELEAEDVLVLDGIRFDPISDSFGGYQNLEDEGYQIFMRYGLLESLAARVEFSQVLADDFDPAWVRDKIVLIGSVNRTSKDLFLTPFNRGDISRTPGVVLHAQVASQILSTVLDGESLPWAWPDWAEVGWIVLLTGAGSGLMVLTQRGLILICFGAGGLAMVAAVSLACFEMGGWVPVVAPASAFFLSAAGARISKSYQRRYWEARRM